MFASIFATWSASTYISITGILLFVLAAFSLYKKQAKVAMWCALLAAVTVTAGNWQFIAHLPGDAWAWCVNNPITLLWWSGFSVFVIAIMAFDLGVMNKKDHVPTLKEAAWYSVFYVVLSLGFGGIVWWLMGHEMGMQFISGYLIEKSMSVDNLMMFIVIFKFFSVPGAYHHRVLFWGVVGAIAMRFVAILVGAAAISMFHPFLLLFAALLFFAAYKIFFLEDDDEYKPNSLVEWFSERAPMTKTFDGHNFTTRVMEGGKLVFKFTPLALVLVAIESTDLLFAADSIPAIFAVSKNPFILFSSNICAILGLRALYFVVERVLEKLVYLKKSLGIVLAFVGFKMVLESFHSIFEWLQWHNASKWTDVPSFVGGQTNETLLSLAVIVGILVIATIASLLKTRGLKADDKNEEPAQQKDNK